MVQQMNKYWTEEQNKSWSTVFQNFTDFIYQLLNSVLAFYIKWLEKLSNDQSNPKIFKNCIALKKGVILLLLLYGYQWCFILNWLLQEFQQGIKPHHFWFWHSTCSSQSAIQASMLSCIVSQAIYRKTTKNDICTQLHYKSYLIYNHPLLILFVSALPCIWTLTCRCLLNNLNFYLSWSLLWRIVHTKPSHS